ncbi:hypothetical protein M427DRAFT_60582 [Gonapodya prolifera JEL478]|uniref:Uncharacterized protein n=1 Tax=Gonapodya prolifera (strain JEL478) TaxID=1344416 RepID=A0A139A4G7_GONPJ|nr:hypothetical protein M427DRAFT_60582 [Gonapodya prolifera JEL478]|eukprot:KXS11569.1 hypothetical protein M427DRAFT_60582 [Gonapodya prolifera JEL478]
MYETGDSFIINVELEEVTDRTRHLLVTPEFLEEHRTAPTSAPRQPLPSHQSMPLSLPLSPQSPVGSNLYQSPSLPNVGGGGYAALSMPGRPGQNGRGPGSVAQISIPSAAEARGYGITAPPSPPSSVSMHPSGSLNSNGAPRLDFGALPTPNSTGNRTLNGNGVGQMQQQQQPAMNLTRPSNIAAGIISEAPGPKNAEPIVVTVAGKEYVFPLVWKNASRDGTEEVMGILGKNEWSAQRNWGYKHVKYTDMDFMISYGPRESSFKKLKGASLFSFTMFFNTRPIFQSALNKYHRKFNSLSPADFKMYLIDPISQVKKMDLSQEIVVTDWACIQPPAVVQVESAMGSGEYHCLYLIKDAKNDMTDLCRKRVETWIVKALEDGGTWSAVSSSRSEVTSVMSRSAQSS